MAGEQQSKTGNRLRIVFVSVLVITGFAGSVSGVGIPPSSESGSLPVPTVTGETESATLAKSPTQTGCAINSVELHGTQDRDGDGYASRFSIVMDFDSKCYGEYDDGILDNPPLDPAFELYIEDALAGRALNFEDYSNSGERHGESIIISIFPEQELYDQLSRGRIDVRVDYFDNDPPHEALVPRNREKVDESSDSILWEPESEDPPTTTTSTTTTTETPTTTTTTTPTDGGPTTTTRTTVGTDDSYEIGLNKVGQGSITYQVGSQKPQTLQVNASQVYQAGTTLTLEAVPAEGYVFDHWSGTGLTDPCRRYSRNISIELTEDSKVTAHFVREDAQGGEQPVAFQANTSPVENRTVTATFSAAHPDESVLANAILNVTSVPDTWTVVNQSSDGGSWFPSSYRWFWQSPQEGCVNANVTFQIPANASTAVETLTATLTPGDGQSVSTDLTVTVAPALEAHVESAPSQDVPPGENVTLTYSLTNNEDAPLEPVALRVASLPDGWAVVTQSAERADWAPNQRLWLWSSLTSNDTVTASVTLRVPPNASAGSYRIESTAAGGENTASISKTITVSANATTTTAEPASKPTQTRLTTSSTTRVASNCSRLTTLEQVQIDREKLPDLNQNLTKGDALEFAVRYEVAYAEEHVVPDDAGMSEPTATVNQTADGYLVKVSYIYGGTSVITAPPTGNQTGPATTVIEWDEFPEVYYYVSPTRALRFDGPTPPENPRTGGKVIYCDA